MNLRLSTGVIALVMAILFGLENVYGQSSETKADSTEAKKERRLTGSVFKSAYNADSSAATMTPPIIGIDTLGSLTPAQSEKEIKPDSGKWYDKMSIRGYMQIRYNRLAETNPNLKNEQGDRSIGDNQGIMLRRARLIFSSQITDRVFVYIQPDLASTSGDNHFAQLRDAYVDLGLDKRNVWRIRAGQSKVPYGYEILQSSSNRLPLDRSDPLNSAFTNERDLGVFFYWTPLEKQELFKDLVGSYETKGSGNYGIFALGTFNGQTANKPSVNNYMHWVTRFTYPTKVGTRIIEPGIQAYTGMYTVTNINSGVTQTGSGTNNADYRDARIAASFVMYPGGQVPWGFSTEWNIGKGPEYDKDLNAVTEQNLWGGYILVNYLVKVKKQYLYPYVRAQIYDGGKKHEIDARSYNVKEIEFGSEWLPFKACEFTASYVLAHRIVDDARAYKDYNEKGGFLRLQLQVNF